MEQNILIAGKNLPESVDLAESFALQGFDVIITGRQEEKNFSKIPTFRLRRGIKLQPFQLVPLSFSQKSLLENSTTPFCILMRQCSPRNLLLFQSKKVRVP